MKPTPCRGCGKPIVFAINKDTGMVIPLDPKAPVYGVLEEADGEIVCKRLELGWSATSRRARRRTSSAGRTGSRTEYEVLPLC